MRVLFLSGQIEIISREQGSGELCVQENKANAKLTYTLMCALPQAN